MTPGLSTRLGLVLLLAGSIAASVYGPPLVGVLGLVLVVVVAGTREDRTGPAVAWAVAALVVQLGGAVAMRGPDTILVEDVVQLGLIPVALVIVAQQAWAVRRKLSGALATSEVARAKLLRSNQELETALGTLGALVENLADGLVAVTVKGAIELANPSMERLLSIESIARGMRAERVLPGEIQALIAKCLETAEVATDEVPLEAGIGLAVASPVERGGSLWGAVVLVRDITLDKEIDRMKSDFIAVVSHEMRTPLTSVIGFAKLISNQLEKRVFPVLPDEPAVAKARDKIRGNLEVIALEGGRLFALISDVLDLAKLESGQVAWVFAAHDPGDLASDAVRATEALYAEREDIDVVVEIDADLPTIQGDRGRLLQVLINLLGNALKFTERGTVTVAVRGVGEAVEFSVADTGVGIGLADRDAVFDKFRQVGDTMTDRPSGTGLGLPICREIVVRHGGEIGVESEVDVGSRFFFTIPVRVQT